MNNKVNSDKKILISGVGGSVFPYLFRSQEKGYVIFGMDSNKMIERIYPDQNIISVPLVRDDSYEEAVENIVNNNEIDFYVPLIDEELIKSFNIASRCKNLKLIVPKKTFVELCLDKLNLMRELKRLNISSVETFLSSDYKDQLSFPIFLKPRVGRGSRNTRKITQGDQLKAFFSLENCNMNNFIVQEYLEGTEYTVSVVVNNLNKLIAIVPKRIVTKKGITQCAVTERNSEIDEVCIEIVDKLKPSNPFNVQLKVTQKGVQVFEINPRFSTTSILTIEAGVNELELAIKFFNSEKVDSISSFKEDLCLFRRWEAIFCQNNR